MTNLVLASASVSRARMLTAAGVPFTIDPADIDEGGAKATGAPPAVVAENLAGQKAVAVSMRHPEAWVLGADQVLVFEGGLVSKCRDATFQKTAKDRVIKGSRHPHSKGVKRGGKLYYRGNVDPGWGHRPVSIQKKNCKSCGWHGYKTVRTSRKGGYSARIYAPSSGRWYFRSVVKASKPRFVKATGGTIYTYRARTARGAGAGIGG